MQIDLDAVTRLLEEKQTALATRDTAQELLPADRERLRLEMIHLSQIGDLASDQMLKIARILEGNDLPEGKQVLRPRGILQTAEVPDDIIDIFQELETPPPPAEGREGGLSS